ncbi:hypothetical protein QMG83_09675 [Salinibacterium sp. G-O1]|uniref:hypothetical protein n=1 Tax=Salinibacterium sp. G-O1 TaxID=3046208 RepID=UPI0024BBD6E2|nr:hypothetical protein [Salinibacterium sp. G-O1]MDJ0335491.1 hypothetical protein [Salinibacterium sp. G-O1]
MAITVKQMLSRHGAFVSGVTGIAVAMMLVAQGIVQAATVFLAVGGQMQPTQYLLSFGYVLVQAVPFGIGFFLSLWLVAPIAEELRVPHVITRAILATGIASTLVFIVSAVLVIVGAFTLGTSFFGNSFPFPQFDGGGAGRGLLVALAEAISGFVMRLPLGVLAGILLWIWRKNHPPRRPLEGMIDL